MMVISGEHHDGSPADEFPVAELPKGAMVTLCLRRGGIWQCIIEEAYRDYILVKGKPERPIRFDIGDVETLRLFWQ
jgi:hypothetical protein